jgi:hypothetical protein
MMRRRRSSAAYLAILAMALQALWPLLAQAKPRSVVLVPLCTVEGVTHYLELPAGKTPAEQHSSAQHEHCSFCSFSGDRLALPPVAASFLPIRTQQTQAWFVEVRVHEAKKPYLARPRAPPAVA